MQALSFLVNVNTGKWALADPGKRKGAMRAVLSAEAYQFFLPWLPEDVDSQEEKVNNE